MKIKSGLMLCVAAVLLGAVSCTDTSGLETRLDSLESRVTALEKVVNILNDNVKAIQSIIEGKTINNVDLVGGQYIITLSNGQVLTLTQGSVGMGKAPLLSVDKDGYWMVDYQDGQGASYILYNGAKVVAVGQDGITPLFGVSEAGNWTVSYDGGATYKEVKDPSGNSVKAIAEGEVEDSYFANVTYDEESLVLTMKNGQQYTAPVVGGFLFKIVSADGDQIFRYGEKKTYSIEKKGISDAVIICPKDWDAWFTDQILTIKAPEKPDTSETKATIADSRKDVSVIAYSEAGHVAVSKVKVYIDGGGGSYDDPVAGIRFVEAKSSKLTFNIVLEYASVWYWMCKKTSDPAPTAAELMTSGTLGDDNRQIVVEGLLAETSYTMYVLPLNSTTHGAIASCEASTTGFENYFEAWQAGYDVKVGGVAYNKESYGEGTLLTTNSTITASGVYFVEPGLSISLAHNATNPYKGSLLIICNTPSGKADLKFEQGNGFNKGTEDLSHYVVGFKNLTIGAQDAAYKCFGPNWWGDSEYGRVVYDGCRVDIKGVIMQKQATGQEFQDLTIVNCDICILSSNTAKFVENWNGSGFEMGSFTCKNNVIWAKEGECGFQFIATTNGSGVPYASLDVENNTFYNVNSSYVTYSDGTKSWYSYFAVASVKSDPIFKNNLFYTSSPKNKGAEDQAYANCIKESKVKFSTALASIQNGASNNWSDYPQTTLISGSDGCSSDWTYSFTLGVTLKNNSTVESFINPFESENTETGEFVKKTAYQSYGATR